MKRQLFFLGTLLLLIAAVSSCNKAKGPYYNATITATVQFNGTVLEYLESQKGIYDSMVIVIRRYPDLVQKLSSPGAMTLFAIPNTAFELAQKNFNRERAKQDSVPLYFKPAAYNLNRPDSGMYHYEALEDLITRYIFDSVYNYDELAKSTSGFPTHSLLGYQMNLMAVQQNAVGATKDGPKVIELSDMNNSIFRRYWKSALTSTIAAVQTSNALVHVLTQNHEFGFASFTQKLLDPTIDRGGWVPIAWHSQYLGTWGGTVFHALDNDYDTRWHTLTSNPPPLPIFFTVDMKSMTTIGGLTIKCRGDGGHDGSPVDFNIEFAPDGANLSDSSSWTRFRFFYPPDASTIMIPKRFNLDRKITARYFRFTVNQVFSGRLYTDRPYSNLDEIWMNY
ncbi:discoidin domain-containing protein [Niabella beijingensis]|uniref:discoidin domain-containing protein n=1 Tax=Niabella beijingensis TaxID=2872700 RepID=UPI001CBB19C0|nr:discoidin domain-containing protein [Niabella beijingensis]MBZ4191039.1 discoidin domain-containing protein [Niabella beijingensis]